jgi:hypothetical protein
VQTVRVQPDRTTLAVVLVMALGALPLAFSSWWLAPSLLVPVGALVWVLRARVVGTPEDLEICNGLGVRRVAWDDVAGFEVPRRGPVRLLQHGQAPIRLSALNRRELPRLLELSQPS